MKSTTIIIGQKISELTIVANSKQNRRKAFQCKCSCGNLVVRRNDYLERAIRENRVCSCGCKHPRKLKGKNSPRWKGCGDISGFYFISLKNSAEKRGIKFNVDIDFIWELFEKQNGKCALSGLPLRFCKSNKWDEEQTASLDRIDSNKDYTPENVQWVHKKINLMKNTLSNVEFKELCDLVSNY